ncbi:MAG: hypothetical protein J6X07_07345 [Prevotella sp.]|nr:hypothetical protein [Prevotella sp.]
MTAIELRAELFREMSPLLDNESAMTKMLAFVKSLVPAKKTKAETEWANRFAGAWKDSRSAEEIISDIRESRTNNSRDIELCKNICLTQASVYSSSAITTMSLNG